MFPVRRGVSITNANVGKSPDLLIVPVLVFFLGHMHIKKKSFNHLEQGHNPAGFFVAHKAFPLDPTILGESAFPPGWMENPAGSQSTTPLI